MVETTERKKKRSDFFLGEMHNVFTLGSGGIGIHLSAVKKLFSGNKLSSGESQSIQSRNSNLFASPYVQGWSGGDNFMTKMFPNNPCPNTEKHRILIKEIDKEFLDINRDDINNFKQFSIHKLGAMLAIIDQILFDAYTSGQPIPASYRPPEYQEEWKKSFDKDLPTIEELYLEAHEVLTDFASPDDPLIAHLLPSPNLTYFLREPAESIKSEGLSKEIIEQLKVLQTSHKIHSTGEDLPTLPKPWEALSTGGDTYKLIAANQKLGIVAKRYARPEYAAIVSKAFESIRQAIEKSGFPLLLPLGIYEDTLVFPLVVNKNRAGQDYHDMEVMRDLKKILEGISLPLDLASFLSVINSEGDKVVFIDPFQDAIADLYKKTGLFLN